MAATDAMVKTTLCENELISLDISRACMYIVPNYARRCIRAIFVSYVAVRRYEDYTGRKFNKKNWIYPWNFSQNYNCISQLRWCTRAGASRKPTIRKPSNSLIRLGINASQLESEPWISSDQTLPNFRIKVTLVRLAIIPATPLCNETSFLIKTEFTILSSAI